MSQVQQGVLGALTPSGGIPVVIQGNSILGSGSKTVPTAGTRVQLSSISVPCKKLTIQGSKTNTQAVYIGDSTVSSSNGIYVFPTQIYVLTPSNLNIVYLDVDVNGEGVSYLYEN